MNFRRALGERPLQCKAVTSFIKTNQQGISIKLGKEISAMTRDKAFRYTGMESLL